MHTNVSTTPAEGAEPITSASLAVGIQFRPASKIYTFRTDDADLEPGTEVIVETETGHTMALVASRPQTTKQPQGEGSKRVLRRATDDDREADLRQGEKEHECFTMGQRKIAEHRLDMKLVAVELEEEGRKACFIFYAEQRIDFRNLVKELAQALRLRIEMRQIGSRDETKVKGCMGPCGREVCCAQHLRQFQSISISMAKHQGLAPNPAKLTGMCNKLKCCLAYEHAVYDEMRQGLPKPGAAVNTPEGPGKVTSHNVLKRECAVHLYGGGDVRFGCEHCTLLTPAERDAAMESARKEAQERFEERQLRMERRRGGMGASKGQRDSRGSQGSRPSSRPMATAVTTVPEGSEETIGNEAAAPTTTPAPSAPREPRGDRPQHQRREGRPNREGGGQPRASGGQPAGEGGGQPREVSGQNREGSTPNRNRRNRRGRGRGGRGRSGGGGGSGGNAPGGNTAGGGSGGPPPAQG